MAQVVPEVESKPTYGRPEDEQDGYSELRHMSALLWYSRGRHQVNRLRRRRRNRATIDIICNDNPGADARRSPYYHLDREFSAFILNVITHLLDVYGRLIHPSFVFIVFLVLGQRHVLILS
jgi:hypothetical protein